MKLEEALSYTEKCFNGEPATCSWACPFRLDIRDFLGKAENGKWNAAYKLYRNAVAFPVAVSLLCDAPCRSRCQRQALGDAPIAVLDIEAAVIKYAGTKKAQKYVIPPKEGRVAVIGAGLAGLSCALGLAQKRIDVTVYEREAQLGGALRMHPRFDEIAQDIQLQFSAAEAEFRLGEEIASLESLAGYSAVYIATGTDGEHFGCLESWDSALFSCSTPGVFLGGALTGSSPVEGIAQGIAAARNIEIYLQLGKISESYGASSGDGLENCGRSIGHEGAESIPAVIAASPDGYTSEEAAREAARCLKCDCDKCMSSCEMLRAFRKKPHKIATEVYTDQNASPPYSSHTITRETFSCNICGYCKSVCPEGVDIGALLRVSRAERMNAGSAPAALHDFWMREMDFNTGEAALCAPPPGAHECEYVFFPGCQLGASRPDHVRLAYGLINSNNNCGIYLGCCGAPAWWAGDDRRFFANLSAIRANWESLGRPIFVFACATCVGLFGAFAPDIAFISLYELLDALDSLAPVCAFGRVSVFDPCSARGGKAMRAAVRSIVARSGAEIAPLPELGRCCGYGGHMRVANPKLYDEIVSNRAAASGEPYIVYCANCREVFAAYGKECSHILDVALGLATTAGVPTISEKRANSLELREEFAFCNLGSRPPRSVPRWDGISLVMGAQLRERLDRELIAQDDIKEAIFMAQSSGAYFTDEASGARICSLVKPVLTYWALYKPLESGIYEILDAYCHRMRFEPEAR
ncbi:MAG: FAD-dependent oxidoreductase [Oscillospiraceae bacterium]|jgi:Fe-S oxidoreductase|nr:FAD-dependent oxidoreductase [Oscillospiraceae bacterium]